MRKLLLMKMTLIDDDIIFQNEDVDNDNISESFEEPDFGDDGRPLEEENNVARLFFWPHPLAMSKEYQLCDLEPLWILGCPTLFNSLQERINWV